MEVEDDLVICYPELPNISCWKPSYSTETLVIDIVMYSTAILIVILNLFIIISISHFRQLHTPTNILLLSLAVSDFLVGLLLMPLQTIRMNHCWMFGMRGCAAFFYLSFIILSASVGNMVLISVDRYLAICDPLHYTTRITLKRAKICVFLLWFCSVVYNFGYFVIYSFKQIEHLTCLGKCYGVELVVGAYSQLLLNFIVPVTVIIILYTRIFVVAMSQVRAMRSHITAVTKQISVTKTAKKSELKAARTLGVLVVVFLMCLFPTYFVSLKFGQSMRYASGYFTLYLYYFNSCLNPLIYALFYSWFRKAVKLIVTLQILQPGSCEANIL